MGLPVAAPTASSLDEERPTTYSVPELNGTPHTIYSERLAGSQEETNTKTELPQDAIFTYRLELNTSLSKIWIATIKMQQIKANAI